MSGLPRNPWLDIPSSAAAAIQVFNRRAAPRFKIYLNLVPEPFFGPFEAPAVVLLLNPGVSREDAKAHVSPKLQRLLLENLHRNDSEMPHVHLTPGASHPGAKWWTTAVSGLPDSARTHVARSLLAVQYFPYHSQSFAHGAVRLPSQEFGFALVRHAMSRAAAIVLARGRDYWLGAIPELDAYPRRIDPSNVRRFSLSRGNLKARFDTLCQAIESSNA
jgi:hypothetical protein